MPTTTDVPCADLSAVAVAPSARTRRAGGTTTVATVLHEAAQACRAEADKYLQAGNLEETLAHHLRLAKLHEHRKAFCTTAQQKKTAGTELQRVYAVLEQLHTKFQAKKDFFHGCLDDDADDGGDDTNDASSKPTKIDCTDIQPLDASRSSTTLASIVGNDAIKQDILNGIVQPFKQPLLFSVRRSFLFYGPPGTGKTMFAKASAHSLDAMCHDLSVLYFAPTTDALKDKYVGGTERKITHYFRCVQQHAEAKAAETGKHALGVIFIDEIDSLARSRETDDPSGTTASATNTLLQMMDGFTSLPNVIVMAATNYPWQLDDAVLSRFQEKIYVRLPDLPTTTELVRYNIHDFYHKSLPLLRTSDVPLSDGACACLDRLCDVTDEKLQLVAKRLHTPKPYSPSNIKDVCQQVFRKSARQAHVHGVFYKVRTTTSTRGTYLTASEREVLVRVHDRYASAVTYERLCAAFPDAIAKTTPINVQTQRATSRPTHITVGDTVYTYCALWGHEMTKSTRGARSSSSTTRSDAPELTTYVQALQRFSDVHVYVNDAQAPRSQAIEFAVFRAVLANYGAGSVHVVHSIGVGTLSHADLAYIHQYSDSKWFDVQRYLAAYTGSSPLARLLDSVRGVYFHDTQSSDVRFWTMPDTSIDHKAFASAAPVDLLAIKTPTHEGHERFAMWLTGASHTTVRTQLTRVETGVECTQTVTNASDDDAVAIGQQAFSLHVDFDTFFDAVDPKHADAVLPTSGSAEVERLNKYAKGE